MRQDVNRMLERLVGELRHLFDENLVSVCVYGSVAFRDDTTQGVSGKPDNINVMVIVRTLNHFDLKKAASILKWWEHAAHALPIFMTEQEWRRSADIFALEYADIRDNHRIVYGEDLYSAVQVDSTSLRLICELELHRLLIRLRQQFLLHQESAKTLQTVLEHNLNSLAALFRGIVRLEQHGQAVPQAADAVFDALKAHIPEYDPAPFHRVAQLKSHQLKGFRGTEVFTLYQQVLQQTERVCHYVDSWFDGSLHLKEGVPQ